MSQNHARRELRREQKRARKSGLALAEALKFPKITPSSACHAPGTYVPTDRSILGLTPPELPVETAETVVPQSVPRQDRDLPSAEPAEEAVLVDELPGPSEALAPFAATAEVLVSDVNDNDVSGITVTLNLLGQKLETLARRHATLNATCDRLRTERDREKEKAERAGAERGAAFESLGEQQAQCGRLAAEIARLTKESEALRQQIESAKHNYESASKDRDASNRARDELILQNDRLQADNAALTTQITLLQESIAATKREYEELLDLAQAELNEAVAALEPTRAALEEAKRDRDEYLAVAEAEIQEARANREAIRIACDDLVAAADQRAADAVTDKVRVETALEDARQEITRLQQPPAAAAPDPANAEALVAQAVEDRMRAISGDLYSRSLNYAAGIRSRIEQFHPTRQRLYELRNTWNSATESAIKTDRLAEQIDIARGELTSGRTDPNQAYAAFAAVIDRTVQLRETLDRIEIDYAAKVAEIARIRSEHRSLTDKAKEARDRAVQGLTMIEWLGGLLTCPREVTVQFNETIERVNMIDATEEERERALNMLRFQTSGLVMPTVLKNVFDAVPGDRALGYRYRDPRTHSVFTDAPERREEIRRLILMAFAFSRAKEAADGEEKGLGLMTIVETVLPKGGLIHEDEINLAQSVARAVKPLLESVSYASFVPNAAGRAEAEACRGKCTDGDAVVCALRFGLRAHWDAKYANRKKSSA